MSLYWKCQITGWTGLALVLSAGALVGSVPLPYFAWASMVAGIGLACTHLLRLRILQRGWLHLPLGPLALRIVATSILIAPLAVGLSLLGLWLILGPPPNSLSAWAWSLLIEWTSLLLMWQLGYFGFHAQGRVREMEAQRWRAEHARRDAELRSLRTQVNPEFLLRSLRGVESLIATDPGAAQGAVTSLASLLRHILGTGTARTVSLGEELEATGEYLALEGLCYGDGVTCRIDARPEVLHRRIPPMLVRAVTEHAVGHAHGAGWAPLEVEILADARGADLFVEVRCGVGDPRLPVPAAGLPDARPPEPTEPLFTDGARVRVRSSGPTHATWEIRFAQNALGPPRRGTVRSPEDDTPPNGRTPLPSASGSTTV